MYCQGIHGEHRVHAVHGLSVALEAIRLLVLHVISSSLVHFIVGSKVTEAYTAFDAAGRETLSSSERTDAAKTVVEVGVEHLGGTVELANVIAGNLECICCN